MNNYAAVYGRVTARYLVMDSQSSINEAVLTPMLTCFADGFDSAQINPDSWVVAQRNSSTLPSVQNGRLRLTENTTNQATSATFQRLFPGASNLVTVEFDQFAYKTSGSSGADGMAVVLSDSTLTPQPGAFGGPLGYGFKTGISGFAGGWLGVGSTSTATMPMKADLQSGIPPSGSFHSWLRLGHLGLPLSGWHYKQPEPGR